MTKQEPQAAPKRVHDERLPYLISVANTVTSWPLRASCPRRLANMTLRQPQELLLKPHRSVSCNRRRKYDGSRHRAFGFVVTSLCAGSLLALLLTGSWLAGAAQALDSPAKIQRHRQQAGPKQQVVVEYPSDIGGENGNSSVRVDRFRRTDAPSRQTRQQPESECPPQRLIQSLLPAEYLGSPAASQRQHLTRAYCDCTADLLGWHLTCFAGSSGRNQQAASSALPDQLHPAFRGPQLQRQAQQQAAAAAAAAASGIRRLRRRSPARWMGDSPDTDTDTELDEAASNLSSSSGLDFRVSEEPTSNLNGLSSAGATGGSSSSATHEGFGEEILGATASSGGSARPPVGYINTRQSNSNDNNNNNNNNNNNDNDFISLSSSNSFAMMQLNQAAPHQESDHLSAGNDNLKPSGSQQQATSGSSTTTTTTTSNLNSQNNHLMFQTVPVLFSVKYMRNNMIEIDCDQAAPHYKPAMFQGFNVNEISSFTFNNCRLPNLPFSVLLHRTRPAVVGAAAAATANGQSASGQQQLLKPNRQRHQNQVRRRRQADGQPPATDGQEEQLETVQQRPKQSVATSGDGQQPKVKSLTVNLNKVIEQRVLIGLLTGLEQLEELQLNYMRLNVTTFELDLDSHPSTASGATQLELPPATSIGTSSTQSQQQAAAAAPTSTMASLPGSTTQASTTAAPPPPISATRASSSSTSAPSTSTSTTTTTTTTSTTTSTSRPIEATNSPKPSRLAQTVSQLRPNQPLSSSQMSRAPISMGAPRGLMVAQATGVPPTLQPTAAPEPATSTSTQVPSVSLAKVRLTTAPTTQLSPAASSPLASTAATTTRTAGLISVSQTSSVSYTAPSAATTRQQVNKLVNSPSVWYQPSSSSQPPTTPLSPAAGSRLTQTGQDGGQWSTPSQQLQQPVNTPYKAELQPASFGIRTANSMAPLPVSLSAYNAGQRHTFQTRPTEGGQTVGLRSLQPATTTTTIIQSQPTTMRRQQQPGATTQQPAELLVAGSRLPGSGRQRQADSETISTRSKRQVSGGLEEFELSFGELLPNLRSLKLESFIDLSQLMTQTESVGARKKKVKLNSRFKRQFMEEDAPVRDQTTDQLEPTDDTMLAEESHQQEPQLAAPAELSERSSAGRAEEPAPAELAAESQEPMSEQRARAASSLLVRLFSKLTKLRVLQLSSNEMPIWPDNVLFDSRHSLVRLYLISNNIRQLGRHSLANLTELQALDVSSNQLRQLTSEHFRDLVSLHSVRACRNLLRKLPSRLLAQPSPTNQTRRQLELADFSKNRYLSQVAWDAFGARSNLLALNLSECQLADQWAAQKPEQLFASLPDLSSLSLRGNRLRELPAGLFAKNQRLQRLDLSHNQLIELSASLFNANASQLSELLINNNQLAELPEQLLFNLRKLRRLSLAYNRLAELGPKTFLTNQLLEWLDLSHNQLRTLNTQQAAMIPFGQGANLRHLNLAHNRLSNFQADIFELAWSFYTQLQRLDLSHNRFQGQIAMPIFYTIADELQLHLAHNQIQSISVEALMQHEHLLAGYSSELASQPGGPAEHQNQNQQQQQPAGQKVPTVLVRLTGNPIACDCSLEPLLSYSRRVAAATNPALVASIFSKEQRTSQPNGEQLAASSRYSVLEPAPRQELQQPKAQLFYQFKLNDLYCAQPQSLERKLLSHLSIGDLLCPMRDQRLCPRQCQCHYQSAFKTAIVDCNNRRLEQVPVQLTDASNFARYSLVESSSANESSPVQLDKVIIRLDNNQLRSMDQLARLFTVVQLESSGNQRFVRASLDSQPISSSSSSSKSPQAMRSPAQVARGWSRQRRQTTDSGDGFGELASTAGNAMDGTQPAVSTAVLESAEEFRDKHYPQLTCELYLDHNLIDSIPASFLEALDQVKPSAVQSSLVPPQAALPTLMLEPPVHSKLNADGSLMEPAEPTTHRSGEEAAVANEEQDLQHESKLFGRQPLANEKKAALLATISENVRLSAGQQADQRPVTVSPSLVVLSLRHNNLANVEAKILGRLAKLIKSSNTKLYLGHNPFNCSDNLAPVTPASSRPAENQLAASPLGDQMLAASDASSGAYLAPDNGDLNALGSAPLVSSELAPLTPADCPVGQLKSWLTRHHANVGDLDELYCVHMPAELADKLKLNNTGPDKLDPPAAGGGHKWDHNHPWASSLMLAPANNGSLLEKNGFSWNGELLGQTARLIDVNVYDLCPYSGIQLLDSSASGLLSAGHQQALISVLVLFILICLCLLLMLIYFGDTQTILAFVYIHLNPVYSCLRLNESHLDGDKLYDAFVSYSSADRDIVMELIDKLEQPDSIEVKGKQQLNGSRDLPRLDVGLDPAALTDSNGVAKNGTLSRRTNSFQDLSTMSRSTSRIMMGDEALELRQSLGQTKPAGANNNYRLCIHERDWLPGHLISWNIVNSVQNSRRTILILSKDFIKSVWFQVEFHTAYYQMLEDKIDRLIVIVRGELPPKSELDKNLAFLLTTKTYLTWGEKWFWERLHYALPHKGQPPTLVKPTAPLASRHQHHHHKGVELAKPTKEDAPRAEQPLLMANIGKDCSNLLLPVHQAAQSGDKQQTAVSSSASSASSNTRSSASSFLSGNSSTGNLLSPAGGAGPPTATTMFITSAGGASSDLLSTAAGPTRLTVGQPSSEQLTDSGRLTAMSSSSLIQDSNKPPSSKRPLSEGVTSIMLGNSASSQQSSSMLRNKKQERLQNFVDKSISSHLNLSEL